MKKFTRNLALYVLSLGSIASAADEFQDFEKGVENNIPTASKKASDAWRDAKFGMFIHWGPISQMGAQLSHSRNSPSHKPGGKNYKTAAIQPEVYDVQYKTFNPTKFDADAIAKMAKTAGLNYMVFTAKHHAGFAMFDSAAGDYDIMSAPYKKDITKELSDACAKNNMDFGFYYSPRDWYHPDCDSEKYHARYIEFYKKQMNELLDNYGSIYEIWFDGMGPGDWGDTALDIMKLIRTKHPDAMVNDRGGAGADFYTPEHTVSYYNRDQLWEACHTTTGQWGYNPKVGPKSFDQLLKILLYTWGADGNILLNIGPMGDGSMNPVELKSFQQLATWWTTHGEASIRGSRGGAIKPGLWGTSTCKDNKLFLHVTNWPKNGALSFPALDGLKINSSKNLSGGSVAVKQNTNSSFTIEVPHDQRATVATTIELSLNGQVFDIEPKLRVASLTSSAKLSASHPGDLAVLCDSNPHTVWHAALNKKTKEKEIWVEMTWDSPVTIAALQTGRGEEWANKNLPELQIPDGQGGWKTAFKFKAKWVPVNTLKTALTTDKLRLSVKGAAKYPLAELELYAPL